MNKKIGICFSTLLLVGSVLNNSFTIMADTSNSQKNSKVLSDKKINEKSEREGNSNKVFSMGNGLNSSSLNENDGLKTSGKTLTNVDGYEYTVSNNEATITGYSGTNKENLSIPGTIDGYKVTAISVEAFRQNDLIGTVTIPASVSYIGQHAFERNGISKVIINSKILTSALDAFKGNWINNIYINPNIKIPDPSRLEGIFYEQDTLFSPQDEDGMIIEKLGNGTTFPISDIVKISGIDVNSYSLSEFQDDPAAEEEFGYWVNCCKIQGNKIGCEGHKTGYQIMINANNNIPDFYNNQLNVNVDYSVIKAKNLTIPLNSVWKAGDNLVSVKGSDGKKITWPSKKIKVSGSVNTAVSGVYPITYSTGLSTTTVNVTVGNPKKVTNVTVKYVDEDGKVIPSVSAKTISGNVGDNYDATTDSYKVKVNGYTLDESKLPKNAKGTLSDKAQTVTYVYKKDNDNPVISTGKVIVKYQDIDGNKISDDVVKSGKVDETYTTDKKDIEGYTFKEVRGNESGKFTDETQTVVYVYTKNKVNPVTPVVPDTPDEPVNPTPVNPAKPNKPVTPNTPQGKVVPDTHGNKGKNNLPSTAAEKQQLKTIVYGVTAMAGLFMIGAWLLRRKNN